MDRFKYLANLWLREPCLSITRQNGDESLFTSCCLQSCVDVEKRLVK